MLIGIVSDTHGNLDRTQQAVRLLESLEVELVLHCGDVGSVAVLALLDRWPVHFVLGNVDSPQILCNGRRAANETCHDRFGSLQLEGKRVALLHGDDSRRLRQSIQSGQWDLVCYGHTHAAQIATVGTTLVVNPGALHRSSQPSIAVVELPAMRATPIALERSRKWEFGSRDD
jgi:putative phosphoesterase